MKNNEDINNKIRTAVSHSVPDILDSILSDCEKEQKGNVINMNEKAINTNEKSKAKRSRFKSIGTIAAMFALIIIGISSYNLYGERSVDSIIAFDINPSFEIKLNKNEKVLEVNPLNREAEIVISDMDFKNTDLEITVNALIGSMLKNGYLSELSNSILISVENDDTAKSTELQKRISDEISKLLQGYSIDAAILSQTISENDDLDNQAKENNITRGKAQVINQIIKANPKYKFEDLAKLSINDLNLLIGSKHMSLENSSQVGNASDKAYIGYDKAINIALGHAGISLASVNDLDTDLDYDDGRIYYEVEFKSAGTEYEYDIDAVTGSILSFERDRDDDYADDYDDYYSNNQRPAPAAPLAPNGGNDPRNKSYIDANNAVVKALAHAGLSASSIKDLDVELERDDGKTYYEVDFEAAGFEYEYEIDAFTGQVLSFEKE